MHSAGWSLRRDPNGPVRMSRVTTVIIAKDEQENIGRCVDSALSLGRVIVADSGSSDRTREVAADHGAEVTLVEWKGFGPTKNEACTFANTEFILSLDADEVLTEKLRSEIEQAVSSDNGVAGYELPRVTNLCGNWVMHSGWYPEYVLRLFRRDSGMFSDDMLHESVSCDGKSCRLTGLLLHYSYPDMKAYARKLAIYAGLGAEKYIRAGGKFSFVRIAVGPPVHFLKKLLIQRGFADGVTGLWIAVLTAVGQFMKYRYALKGDNR